MNNVELSLEVLKMLASDPNFQELLDDEKIDQTLQAYQKIYRNISQENPDGNPGGGENGGHKSGKVAVAMLQIVNASTATSAGSFDFSAKTDILLKQFKQISTKLSETEF